jgi:hypothetical protein
VAFLDKARQLFGFSPSSGFASTYQLASPFSVGTGLAPVIASDLGYYGPGTPATRLDALKCPPIFRGMALLSTLIAALELEYEDGTPLTEADAWMNRGEGSITAGQRHAALLQDLMFDRDSCYWVQREAGTIKGALKLPRELWSLDWLGNVVIGGKAAPVQEDFIYFQSLLPLGLLEAAADSIEHFHDIKNTIRSRSKNPIPMVELHITDEFEGTEAELTKAQKDWSIARSAPDGAVAFTPKGIQLIAHQINDAGALMTEARNAVRLDFANFLNQAASLLEGANGASGTYENTLQAKDELITLSLATYTTAIEQRLSLAASKPVRFRTSDLTTATAAAPVTAQGNTGTATPTPQGELTA